MALKNDSTTTDARVCVECEEPEPLSAFARNGSFRRRRCEGCEYERNGRARSRGRRGRCKCGAPKLEGRGQVYCEACADRRRVERREAATAGMRATYERDKQPFLAHSATRRARLRGARTEHVSRAVLWQRDEGICGICGHAADPENWHMDHVLPLALGGEHSYANTQVSHPAGNLSKGARVAA